MTVSETATPTRRRAMIALFAAVAATTTSMVGTSTVGTLIASDAVGKGWSGLTSTAGVLGTATGALTLAMLMAKRGRRIGLVTGFSTAIVGALLSTVAVVGERFPLLLFGMVLIGIGNGGAQLARYAAAELFSPERRGSALALIVWAGTIGAILGPSLIAPAARVAESLGLPPLSGSFLLASIMTGIAALASFLLPAQPHTESGRNTGKGALRELLKLRTVRLALAAMVCGQVTMVSVMTMTPVHLHQHGSSLATVGTVLTAHMIGMFALAPLSGRIADRFGGVTTIVAGVGTLVASAVIAMSATASSGLMLMLALFLLGYGWNLCFVGGSSMLSSDLPAEQRMRLQGSIDAIVWGTSAIASLGSGRLLEFGDYGLVAAVAGVVAVIPVVFMLGRRPSQ